MKGGAHPVEIAQRRSMLARWLRTRRFSVSTVEVVRLSGFYERSELGRATALTDLLYLLARNVVQMVHRRELRWEWVS